MVRPGQRATAAQAELPQEIVLRLRHLGTLPEDWDGYGAHSISRNALQKAASALVNSWGQIQGRLDAPFIAPSPDGGLSLEWKTPRGGELLVDVPPEGEPLTFLLIELDSSGEETSTEGIIGAEYHLEALLRKL